MKYKYGMRLRGFSLSCQPMKGLTGVEDDPNGRYYDILTYERQLEPKEMQDYELTFIGKYETQGGISMMTNKERNDRLQMVRMDGATRFYLDIKDSSDAELLKAKEILEDVEAKGALIKDAVVRYINSEDFNLEMYEGPGHRRK